MSRKRRTLRPEEAALWDRVAAGARPLRPGKPAVPEALVPRPPPESSAQEPIPSFRIGEAAARPGGHVLQRGLAERLAAAPVRMDRKEFARMSRGKLRPEGKLDLHGMTLAEAHPALIRFLLRAQAEGRRLVLVVTGKGRDRDDGGPIPQPRGILKTQVPAWIARPPLAGVVLQLAEAHRRHGGEGAYYVYLRRPPGAPDR